MMLTFGIRFYLIGAIYLFLLGFLVGPFLNYIAPWKKAIPPEKMNVEDWNNIVIGSKSHSGFWIGRLEAITFFISFATSEINSILIVGGWLAFKVASKWETWSNVNMVPKSLPDIKEIEFFKARRAWGNTLYERFIIGTLINILMGFSAVLFAKWIIRNI